MTKEQENKIKSRFSIVEVPATYGVAIKDEESGTTLMEQQILVEILNKLDIIEKSIA